MRPAFPASDYYGSSATPRRQQRTARLPQTRGVRRAPPGRFPRSPLTGRQGRRPAVPRGHRHTAPQHTVWPRPPERKPDGQDDPQQKRGSSAPTAHNRQLRGCCAVSGLLTLVRLLHLSALLPHPARWRQTVARLSGAAPALRRTSGIGLPLSFTQPLAAAGGGSFHPTRSYGASWRSPPLRDEHPHAITRERERRPLIRPCRRLLMPRVARRRRTGRPAFRAEQVRRRHGREARAHVDAGAPRVGARTAGAAHGQSRVRRRRPLPHRRIGAARRGAKERVEALPMIETRHSRPECSLRAEPAVRASLLLRRKSGSPWSWPRSARRVSASIQPFIAATVVVAIAVQQSAG
jgi:hypothetical protein